MKRNLCLLPIADFGECLYVWTNEDGFITAEIDDDDSATSKACEIVQSMFGIKCCLKTMNRFRYLGEIEHNHQSFSLIQFDLQGNQNSKLNKRVCVQFNREFKEFRSEHPGFRINDSFVLAVGLKILT